ncbi:MAG: site-2 protease family protein [Acidobacteriia bacterium]|nr:site-2 protease family protein [Terriglobia bacterium]
MPFDPERIAVFAVFMLVLLLSLSWHESAHAWMADRLGDYTARYMGRVSLNPLVHIDIIGTIVFPAINFFWGVPLLGWAKPTPVNPLHLRDKRYGQLRVAAAGPISNCILAVIFIIADKALVILSPLFSTNVLTPMFLFFQLAIYLNIGLAVFNLIPIPPLDGSHILEALLPYEAAQKFQGIQRYGGILLMLMVFTPVFSIIYSPVLIFLRYLFYWFNLPMPVRW